jgi:hypothetical protein
MAIDALLRWWVVVVVVGVQGGLCLLLAEYCCPHLGPRRCDLACYSLRATYVY